MTWHVQYRRDTVEQIVRYPSPEEAIEFACRLIEEGCDVFGIGTGPLTDSIERNQIDRIYALWARARYPFGLLPVANRRFSETRDMPHVDGEHLPTIW